MDKIRRQNHYLLLQVNDALFPIGGYSHSYGLETYIQKGIVTDETTARTYITNKIRYSLAPSELLCARLAYEAAERREITRLLELEEMLEASKIPMEIREAARKLGSRFAKTLIALDIDYKSDIFKEYLARRKGKTTSHACAYGVFCAAAGIGLSDALAHFLYAQTSAMVTNCVKSIPLSQSAGQKILAESCRDFEGVLQQVSEYGPEMLGASAPGFDLRCMQHENLYSRIYMS